MHRWLGTASSGWQSIRQSRSVRTTEPDSESSHNCPPPRRFPRYRRCRCWRRLSACTPCWNHMPAGNHRTPLTAADIPPPRKSAHAFLNQKSESRDTAPTPGRRHALLVEELHHSERHSIPQL
eukprot:1457192-Rhodomonas_salina.1